MRHIGIGLPESCWDESSGRLRSPVSRKVPLGHTLIMSADQSSAVTLAGGSQQPGRGHCRVVESLAYRRRSWSRGCGSESSYSLASEEL
ncbi:hypothetical protein NDU88_004036 [Pleurodeles waltl]|uniref:Uncharacterized protein n=1 Tax=Pleurodeles waltl TaxID=8319 RepID=A0AAV7TSC0_PLEWA|nr:hypothetical protein NDU88_004036 [Pleurodeles waltl]